MDISNDSLSINLEDVENPDTSGVTSLITEKPSFLTFNLLEVTADFLNISVQINDNNSTINKISYRLDEGALIEFGSQLDSLVNFKFIINIFSFNFIPGSEHSLKLIVENAVGTTSAIKYFKIPQSFPEPVSKLKFSLLTEDFWEYTFLVSFTEPTDWGYWGGYKRGYKCTWIVDGIAQNESFFIDRANIKLDFGKASVELPFSKETLIKSSYNLQICVQPWVKDTSNNFIIGDTEVISKSKYFTSRPPEFRPVTLYFKFKNSVKRVSLINSIKER